MSSLTVIGWLGLTDRTRLRLALIERGGSHVIDLRECESPEESPGCYSVATSRGVQIGAALLAPLGTLLAQAQRLVRTEEPDGR